VPSPNTGSPHNVLYSVAAIGDGGTILRTTKWRRTIADSDADCYANAKANTVSAPDVGATPESGALKRNVSGNSSVTFSCEG